VKKRNKVKKRKSCKCREFKINKINKILEEYYSAYQYSNSLEWTSAPSGEFDEYNVKKIEAEAITATLESIVRILAPNKLIHEE
jgi:hypothetical protein